MPRRLLLTLLIAITSISGLQAVSNTYGLRFLSYDTPSDHRTILKLNSGKPIEIDKSLEIRFRMSLRNTDAYGNIFSLYADGRDVIDYKIIALDNQSKTFRPSLIIGQQLYPIDYPLQGRQTLRDVPVRLLLERQNNRITIAFGNKERTFNADLGRMEAVSVFFGSQRHHNGSADVAPVDIWNVEVERNGKPLYYWELRNHCDTVCLDKQERCLAVAVNGKWLQDDHTTWRQVFAMKTPTQIQYAFNSKSNTFYIINDDSLFSWNAATDEWLAYPVSGKRLIRASDYLYANEQRGTLHSYSLDEKRTASMDPAIAVWDNTELAVEEGTHIDHAQATHGGDTLYTFGGYGYYRFRNELFRINTGTGEVTQLKYTPEIAPRVTSSAALVGDILYIFGGYGNEAGKQELPRKFYNDLWQIDLKTLKAKRLWQSDTKGELTMTPQMFFDADKQAFYVFTSDRQLMKVWLKEPRWQVVTKQADIDTSYEGFEYGLFRSESLQKLFVVANVRIDDVNQYLQIFSIDLPVIDDALLTTEAEYAEQTIGWLWYLLGGVCILAVVCGGLLLAYRWRRVASLLPVGESQVVAGDTSLRPETIPEPVAPVRKYYDMERSSIQMLGELKVISHNGEDITSKFTRRTRNLLILLLLNSVSKSRGIAIRTLDEALWQGMDEESARNNRNVYMRKLRVLLEEVGQIEISNDKIYYKAKIGSDVFIDYQEVVRLMDEMETSYDEEVASRTLELLLRGPLLPGLSTEWLDDFKGDYSSRVISLLSRLENRAMNRGNLDQAYRIAETIMRHDPFSEEALATQCYILTKKKTVGIAKHVYDRFCKNYEQAMGEPYTVSFADVCKGK